MSVTHIIRPKGKYATTEWVSAELSNKVTIGAPQMFDLPFNAGFTSKYGLNVYYKDSFGMVTVHFSFQKSGTSSDMGDISFATLPEGFRPASNVSNAVGGSDINYGRVAGWATMDSSGALGLGFGYNLISESCGSISFLATS